MNNDISRFSPGKLPADILGRLLSGLEGHPRLVVGPRVGEDAAVIDIGDHYLVAKSDPITSVEDRIGWYAVNINANDIACMGAEPAWFLATLLLPEERANKIMLQAIWDDIQKACRELGIIVCGGHTEITPGLFRPIICGQMLGEVSKKMLVRGDGARERDAILLTRPVPVEGAAILAGAKRADLVAELGVGLVERAAGFLDNPGISVVRQALAVAYTGLVHAMHDPTEGGLATGIYELAEASGLGARVDEEAIPISEEGGAICRALSLDPLGVITSGALLLAVPPEGEEKVRNTLLETGALGVRIGTLGPAEEGIILNRKNRATPLPRYDSDEIGRVL